MTKDIGRKSLAIEVIGFFCIKSNLHNFWIILLPSIWWLEQGNAYAVWIMFAYFIYGTVNIKHLIVTLTSYTVIVCMNTIILKLLNFDLETWYISQPVNVKEFEFEELKMHWLEILLTSISIILLYFHSMLLSNFDLFVFICLDFGVLCFNFLKKESLLFYFELARVLPKYFNDQSVQLFSFT